MDANSQQTLTALRLGALLLGATRSIGLRVIGAALGLTTSILLARLLGAEGFGMYAAVIALVGLLGVGTGFGLDRLLVRELARAAASSAWDLASGLLRFSFTASFAGSLTVTVAAAVVIAVITAGTPSSFHLVLLVGLPLIVLNALNRVRATALLGLHQVIASVVPEHVIRPGMLALSIAFVAIAAPALAARAEIAMLLTVAAAIVSLAAGGVWLRRRMPPQMRMVTPNYEGRRWLSSAMPLAFLGVLMLANQQISLLLVGVLDSAASAGIYGAALRMATVLGFGLDAVNVWIMPAAAALWASRDMEGLQRVATNGARIAVLATGVPIAIASIYANEFVGVFGPEFGEAAPVMVVLAVGRLVAALMGSVAVLVVVTGHDRESLAGLALAVAVEVALAVVLIPGSHALGAAIAATAGVATWNIFYAMVVWRRLRIHTTAIGRV